MNAEANRSARGWVFAITLTGLSVYFYVLMEWLFFVTKPSFMSTLTFLDTLQILFIAPLPLIAASVAVSFLLQVPVMVIGTRIPRSICSAIRLLVPSVILTASFLLLIDNFTYTVFNWGIISTGGVQRLIYGFLVIALLACSLCFLHSVQKRHDSGHFRRSIVVTLALVAVSILVAAIRFIAVGPDTADMAKSSKPLKELPNIILLASDGLNSENMSLYDYHLDTTPFIRELAGQALLCENCFANAGCSGASISSMFTGRLPSQTRLIFPPDILKKKDIYRHFPGILKKLGYTNFDMSIRHYADPYDLNMRKSFDWANSREIKEEERYITERLSYIFGAESGYFIQKMRDRMVGRILHSFAIREMEDAFAEVVVQSDKYVYGWRMENFLSFLDSEPSPFFAHLHLLMTHGPKFYGGRQVFSQGKEQTDDWMTDFYDDAILSFDDQVRRLFDELMKRGLIKNTVIVICTDHGMRGAVNGRIPLMFLFPDGEHRGRIKVNVQNLDIAPTLLDYLGIVVPAWMSGISLISSEIDPNRIIFTFDRKKSDVIIRNGQGWMLDKSKAGPPFYSLGSVSAIFYHRTFELKLETGTLEISDIRGHTSPCPEDEIPDPDQIGRLIVDHLKECDYDVSSLKPALPIDEIRP